MRRYIFIIIATAFLAVSCTRLQDVRVTDYAIATVENVGFTGLKVSVRLTVDNPAREFTVLSLSGTVKKSGKDFGVFGMYSPLTIESGTGQYLAPLELSLAESVSPFEMLGLISSMNSDEFTVDALFRIKYPSGVKGRLKLHDIPLDELMSYIVR